MNRAQSIDCSMLEQTWYQTPYTHNVFLYEDLYKYICKVEMLTCKPNKRKNTTAQFILTQRQGANGYAFFPQKIVDELHKTWM